MKRTMRAAVVEEFGKPLVLREWDIPVPGPGQILVRTEACGVCGTDVHAARGDWPVKPALPFIPGHEAIGQVVGMGSGVTLVKGDLRGIAEAIRLSRATMRNIRQNLLFAFLYNALGIPVAAGVLYPVFGLLLSPVIAGAAMSLSSVSVIGNALRLRNVKL